MGYLWRAEWSNELPAGWPAYTANQHAIERLAGAGVVQQIGEAKRDRLFCAGEILAILEAPTRLEEEQP